MSSGYGEAIAAGIYAASNVFSWTQALLVPGVQAAATIKILNKQKDDYDEITKKQRDIFNAAITQYMNEINDLLDSNEFESAYPDVPQAAEYVPVDAGAELEATIQQNMENTGAARDYVAFVNRIHEQNDLRHVLSMDPRFLVNLDIQSKSVQDMMRGNLSVGDVVEVMTDAAEQASLTGRIGGVQKTTARDLGVAKMRVQAAGRREFRESVAWMNSAVSPLSRQGDVRSMSASPQERIQLALTQSQLIQNSLQNVYNTAAQKDPYRMAKLQTKIQRIITRLQAKSSEALLSPGYVPNYGAAVAPVLSSEKTETAIKEVQKDVTQAVRSWFFGPPSSSQDGYQGGNRKSPETTASK
jgi:hypothetical protein